jgi:uncharacterized GH25 family protein
MLSVLALALVMAITAQAHFVYVVPESTGTAAKVIFSDSLLPDENVPITKIKNTKLTLRDSTGKESQVELKEEKTYYAINVPGKGVRTVYGMTSYGVLKKGDDKPFLLQYYPKAIVGGLTAETQKIGEALPVEIIPVIADGKIRFQATAKGKPMAETEISVAAPKAESSEKLTTDKEGFTKAFEAKGTYGVWVRSSETANGEQDGMKYEEIRRYATLVVEFAGK